MDGLEGIYRGGYVFVCLLVLLMAWVAYSSATMACTFDPACSCTSHPSHLGQVSCHDAQIYLPQLNSSKLFTLSLVNNDIDHIEPRLLHGTGLYRLEISKNPLHSLHEEALSGLERTLWELHVTHCQLSHVPGHSLKHLLKLKTLNLSDNEIIEINAEQLRGVGASLQTLILARNMLTVLPAGVFAPLSALETLDLSGNIIQSLDPAVFTPPPPRISRLNLADNVFPAIPYKQLSSIRTLRHVDLSYNRIETVRAGPGAGKLGLNTLILDYNFITQLNSLGMSHFDVSNKTSFRANPITVIEPNAFKGCKISELYLNECHLTKIDPEAFNGLENTLQVLDLSGNNISGYNVNAFNNHRMMKALHLDHNIINMVEWKVEEPELPNRQGKKDEKKEDKDKPEKESKLDYNRFSFSGNTNADINLLIIPRMSHLQSLKISKPFQTSLTAEELSKFSVELEELSITQGSVKALGPNMFRHTRGIKFLDLTDNIIDQIDSNTFHELGHSLEKLYLTHSFVYYKNKLPKNLLKPLSALKVLKINYNTLKSLPEDIRDLSGLNVLHAQDNSIDSIPTNLFEENVHKKLREVDISFNKITKIKSKTFMDLDQLTYININDNIITGIEKSSFANLDKLNEVRLRGNKLSKIDPEGLQNLPVLSHLDLAYNYLKEFNFASLDQVGTLSDLKVNISHNLMNSLMGNKSQTAKDGVFANIKIMDYSHNNMSSMGNGYLEPVQHSLTHLYMTHNFFSNMSSEMFPDMAHLQLLDMSWNNLSRISPDVFRHLPCLQVLNLAGNRLTEIGKRLFSELIELKRLDLSHNQLLNMLDSAITSTKLTNLDLSHNHLGRVPLTSLSPACASRLLDLDLSYNKITSLPTADSFSRFFRLRKLNLANNRLTELDKSLNSMVHLMNVNLANNALHIGSDDFYNLQSLAHLDLTNTSLTYVPTMRLSQLLTLKLGSNALTQIPPDMATNLTRLKHLDLSANPLQQFPAFPQLRSLNLANTQITTIAKNDSFKDFLVLMELNLQHLPLTMFDFEALEELPILRTLHLSNQKKVPNFSIPKWLDGNYGLKELHISLTAAPTLGMEMHGSMPPKLRHIVLSGHEMKAIPDHVLKGVRSPSMTLTIRNTSVDSLSPSVFHDLEYVRNVSIKLFNNNFKFVGNPSTIGLLNVPRKIFLVELSMKDGHYSCDCDLGWVETWQRKMRQFFPRQDFAQDSRETKCSNNKDKYLLNLLKTDLECGWSSAGKLFNPFLTVVLTAIAFLHPLIM